MSSSDSIKISSELYIYQNWHDEYIIGRELTDEEIEKFLINMLVYLKTIK